MSRIKHIPRKPNGVWCYAEKGNRKSTDTEELISKTLVFVHGFGADKDMWPAIVKNMPFHCIMVDLPGNNKKS